MPFGSSILVVLGLLFLKSAQERGVSSWTAMIVVCWSAAAVFPVLTVFGGTLQPITSLWQPAVIGALFLSGQLFMLLAVAQGDVSIAAPVLGVKVLMVPAAAQFFVEEDLSPRIWIAAAIAVIGIALVQTNDAQVRRARILAAVCFALLAACSMTLFDLLIQRWAPAWGAGYFLPIALGSAALFALPFARLADHPADVFRLDAARPLAAGAILLALQAIGMTLTLGFFGDATRVNIVYSLRGLWGVLLTWTLSHRFNPAGKPPSHRTMTLRLIGAVMIGSAVIISLT